MRAAKFCTPCSCVLAALSRDFSARHFERGEDPKGELGTFVTFLGACGSCFANSCYVIARSGQTWDDNRRSCKRQGGDLVSIETLQEWNFINSEIQKITLSGANEWYIGLKKDGQGNWKWVNGKPLTIQKWQSGEPNGDGNVVVMSKDYPAGSQGLFNDLDPSSRKAYICEKAKG